MGKEACVNTERKVEKGSFEDSGKRIMHIKDLGKEFMDMITEGVRKL